MGYTICFIDDSEFEHSLVRNQIAPQAPDMEFVQAYTFAEAKGLLGQSHPSLFLLDLWGKDDAVTEPYFPTRAEIEGKIGGFPTLDYVYGGLSEFKGDLSNEYLKRLFSIVACWRSLFEEVCAGIGQNNKYGLYNLSQARQYYPDTPSVFYTRKALINDAVAMFRAKADGLFIKPSGINDDHTRSLTKEYAPTLAEDLRRIIRSGRKN
ncbi:conserved hypothetical protein [uncultured Desulfobacterium sp.]|uniref:Uncharacterized protein n=1 Tax=uncultured Desulfobacterium sp. TaxID=201089 RepID=A0A445MR71_9BACT|nr:conserved hypothetical protein [uncultured Desulfobacterium sp.]